MAEPGLFTGNNAPAGTRARPVPRLDPLAEVRRDLEAVLALLQATRPPVLGRRKANRFSHAVEAARREVRRALEATGASAGSGPA